MVLAALRLLDRRLRRQLHQRSRRALASREESHLARFPLRRLSSADSRMGEPADRQLSPSSWPLSHVRGELFESIHVGRARHSDRFHRLILV